MNTFCGGVYFHFCLAARACRANGSGSDAVGGRLSAVAADAADRHDDLQA